MKIKDGHRPKYWAKLWPGLRLVLTCEPWLTNFTSPPLPPHPQTHFWLKLGLKGSISAILSMHDITRGQYMHGLDLPTSLPSNMGVLLVMLGIAWNTSGWCCCHQKSCLLQFGHWLRSSVWGHLAHELNPKQQFSSLCPSLMTIIVILIILSMSLATPGSFLRSCVPMFKQINNKQEVKFYIIVKYQ